MDPNFNLRALLMSIQDRLSSDDRERFHYLIGDSVPRIDRERITIGGTLNVIDRLFDQGLVGENDVDFFIQIFNKMRRFDTVKQLQDYQSSRRLPKELYTEPPRERQPTVCDVYDDNCDDDKYKSSAYVQLLSTDDNFPPLNEPVLRKHTTSELPSAPPTKRNVFISPMCVGLYSLFFIQIMALSFCLWFFLHKKPMNAYVLKNGKTHTNITGHWFDHSQNLSLTFPDKLIGINAYVKRSSRDDMYSIEFIYPRNKIEHKLKKSIYSDDLLLLSLNLKKQKLQQIEQCYTNNSYPHLVGLSFTFDNGDSTSFGSCAYKDKIIDPFPDHTLGYALGKIDQYLTGLQFVWYNICPVNSQVTLYAESSDYNIRQEDIYDDV